MTTATTSRPTAAELLPWRRVGPNLVLHRPPDDVEVAEDLLLDPRFRDGEIGRIESKRGVSEEAVLTLRALYGEELSS